MQRIYRYALVPLVPISPFSPINPLVPISPFSPISPLLPIEVLIGFIVGFITGVPKLIVLLEAAVVPVSIGPVDVVVLADAATGVLVLTLAVAVALMCEPSGSSWHKGMG